MIFVKTNQHLHPGDCSAAKRSESHQDSKKYPVNCLYIAKLMLYLVIYIYIDIFWMTNYFIPKITLNHSSWGYHWELWKSRLLCPSPSKSFFPRKVYPDLCLTHPTRHIIFFLTYNTILLFCGMIFVKATLHLQHWSYIYI